MELYAYSIVFRVVRASALAPTPRDAISLYLVEEFKLTFTASNHHVSDRCSKGFQGHGAKGQGHVAMADGYENSVNSIVCEPLKIFKQNLPKYTVFQKKTPTHIIGYKLRSSCLILIIFDTNIPHKICHHTTA